MKANLLTLVASISLLASSCALADDGGLGASNIDNGDSNGLVQSSSNLEDRDSPPMDDRANNGLGAGVTRDGETMGEED
jgi:hypothetical protein